jgi:hypothetical protein
MNWIDALKKLAPTAAALLAGPFAGMAVQALGEALGIGEPTQEKIAQAFKNGQLSGDQLVAVKLAEQNLALKLEELGVRREEIDATDRASARQMQVSTRSNVPAALTFILAFGFLGVLTAMFIHPEIKDSPPLMIMLGALAAEFAAACKFWFGSTNGGQAKTDLLARAPSIT